MFQAHPQELSLIPSNGCQARQQLVETQAQKKQLGYVLVSSTETSRSETHEHGTWEIEPTGWLHGCMAAWLPGCLAAWLPGLAGWLAGCWLAGWLLAGWLVGWLAGWLGGWVDEEG